MIQTFFRIIKFALQNFFRNFWLSLATLTIIIITVLLVNIIVAINQIKIATLTAVQEQVDISLDFNQAVTEADVMKVRKDLQADPRIQEVTLVTPDENLEHFKTRYPDIGDKILPVLERNPLGYSLTIRAKNLDDYDQLLKDLDEKKAFADLFKKTYFNDYRLLTSKASAISDKINVGAIGLAGIFFVIALIIVFNTIRVSIYTHRDEIAIMRLVGATNWFIRTPFLIESILYSLIACAIVIGVVMISSRLLQPTLDHFFIDFTKIDLVQYFSQNGVNIFGTELIVTATINMLSSAVALRRYLRI